MSFLNRNNDKEGLAWFFGVSDEVASNVNPAKGKESKQQGVILGKASITNPKEHVSAKTEPCTLPMKQAMAPARFTDSVTGIDFIFASMGA